MAKEFLPLNHADLHILLVLADGERHGYGSMSDVEEMTGEYHPRQGYGPPRLRELLEKTHKVTLNDAEPFGLFTAVRR